MYRIENKSAILTKKIQNLDIDIAALSQTRVSDNDQLTEITSGVTFYLVDKPKGGHLDGSVGFAIRTALLERLGYTRRIFDLIVKLSIVADM